MIRATAVSLGFSVITADIRDFEKIPGLKNEEFEP
jgi:predicted nucleic acid-binding protein